KQQQASDRIQEKFFNKQLAEIERQLSHLPVAQRQFVSIHRRYSLLENLYVFLMQKKAEADISKASTTSDIIVVKPPMRSGGAITPKVRQNYTVALFAGLVLPLVLFALQELL